MRTSDIKTAMKMYMHNQNVPDASTNLENCSLKSTFSARQSERMKQIGEPLNEISLQFGGIEERPTDMEGSCESPE
jgi:hypothetical protein